MAAFPTYAAILKSGRTQKADYGVLRTDMDGGITKQRPRWTTPIVTRQVTVQVRSTADRERFDSWMAVDLNGGTGWFDWRDLDGQIKQARIVGGSLEWERAGASLWNGQAQLETVG